MTQAVTKHLKWTPAEIMLAILFLLAPLYYHPNLGGEGLRIPHNITIWLVATIFIAYSFLKVLKTREYVLPKYFWMIAAFPVLATLSGFIAGVEQPLKWLFRLLFIWGGLAFFFALFQARLSQARVDRLLFIVVISALIFSLIGILQMWLKLDMPFFLPKSPDGVPTSLFQQINNMATYQVTAVMISVYLSTRPAFRKLDLKSWALVTATVLAAFIVGVSGSRIGALTFLISLIVVLPVVITKLTNSKVSQALLLAVVIGFVGGSSLPGGDKLVDKTQAMQSGYSGEARLGMYAISMGLIAESPFVGHGIGSFGPAWQFAKPEFYTENPEAKLPTKYVSHPHNEIILWLVEGGLIAAGGMFLVVLGVIFSARKISYSRAALYAGVLIPVALHTQVELPLYMSALHWFAFITFLFLVMKFEGTSFKSGTSISAIYLLRVMTITMLLLTLFFYWHTATASKGIVKYYSSNYSSPEITKALANPYLSEQAQWMQMTVFLYEGIHNQNKSQVEQYVEWGKNLLLTYPHVELYVLLKDSYGFLNDKNSFCELTSEGLSIYPNDLRLKSANLESESDNYCH